jgi:hypothetical protein
MCNIMLFYSFRMVLLPYRLSRVMTFGLLAMDAWLFDGAA